jgi:hypothetical protein
MWQALIPAVTSIIDKIIPDPAAAAEAKLKTLELAQKGDLSYLDADVKLALGQMEINKAEAQSGDAFRGGWRPAVGWCCVFGLGYTFILKPLLPWLVGLAGGTVPPLPAIDNEALMVLLFGMLGLGGMRSFERVKGKA